MELEPAPRARSRAVAELEDAPVSPCSHCGRDSRTVQGVCADCWQAKEPGAYEAMRREPKTEPLFDWESLDLGWLGGSRLGWPGLGVTGLVLTVVGLVVGLVLGLR